MEYRLEIGFANGYTHKSTGKGENRDYIIADTVQGIIAANRLLGDVVIDEICLEWI